MIVSDSSEKRFNPLSLNLTTWQVIVDLSAPLGFSVNDRIDPDLCSPQYASVQQVATLVATCIVAVVGL